MVRNPITRRLGRPTRNVDIVLLQDAFLVSAVTMILVIRLQLWATDYPQLGGGRLHIAHLLWGGLFMLIALGILVSFVGRGLRLPAAIVGGIGFGFFIDELGKFITSDNDYFFQPSAAIIYLVFVLLYLLTRRMQRRRGFSSGEYLANAADLLTEAARRDLDEHEKRRALELLAKADPDDPMTAPLTALFRGFEALPPREPTAAQRLAIRLRDRYARLVEAPRFARVFGAVFAVWAVISSVTIVVLVVAVGSGNHLSFIDLASLASSAVSGVLVILGVIQLRRGERLGAYLFFERALLVEIFVGEFFSFIHQQFGAVFGLALNVLLLVTVKYMIRGEHDLERLGAVH